MIFDTCLSHLVCFVYAILFILCVLSFTRSRANWFPINCHRSGSAQDSPYTPVFTGPGPLGTGPGLAVPQFLQVRDRCHGLASQRSRTARDSPYPSFYKSGAARDWPGTRRTPIFTSPRPLGTGPGPAIPELIVTGPGPFRTRHTPVFAGPGPLRTCPGLTVPQFLQVRGRCPGLAIPQLSQVRDRSGLVIPQFLQVLDLLHGIGSGFAVPQLLQVQDRSGFAQDWQYPNCHKSGTAWDALGTGPGLAVPQFLQVWDRSGLAVPQFLQVRDRLGLARDSPYPNFYRSGTAYPVWLL